MIIDAVVVRLTNLRHQQTDVATIATLDAALMKLRQQDEEITRLMFGSGTDAQQRSEPSLRAGAQRKNTDPQLAGSPSPALVKELEQAFAAGWDAAKRDENAADDEDIADAADVAFREWQKKASIDAWTR